ncbi:sensor histidine kinase [Paenibacillus sp. F411]|uniref:cache domain-containing sensor histidine kinase n=1 Tax=Paenibacillus sp. F411 TaxID=2820239 RepID=UPI001AAE57A5|nr:sensor histidine kinase [Paenibacillus sp. F411]MBO2942684.1 sensor histidine kinase [Paenibacillus sp. F411]
MKASLARQVFLYFLIVIILSLTSLGLFSYFKASRALDRQMEKYISQMTTNMAYQTDIFLDRYKDVSSSMLSSWDIKYFLDMDYTDSYSYFYYSSQIRRHALEPLFVQYPQIHQIYLIGKNGRAVVNDSSIHVEKRLEWLWERTPAEGGIVVLNDRIASNKTNIVTLARRVRGFSSYEPTGVLAVELNVQELTQMWQQKDLGKDSYFFVLDELGRYVYHPESSLIGQKADEELKSKVLDGEEESFISGNGDDHRLFVTRSSLESGWKLTVSIPVKELREPVNSIRSTTITVGLITLALAAWLAFRFGHSIVSPIRRLNSSMRQTEKGNWQQIQGVHRTDEIGGLMHSYNIMVSRLSEMIEKVYETELANQKAELELQESSLERQKAEFQALQLQINPHFLYNTLATVNGYAIVQHSGEISEIVEAMSYMLRYSIQTNLEEITIANELNHVRNYLIILKHRSGREIEIDVDIDPELLLEKCVRLTLQPLVENIFQHAFPDGMEDYHRIRIDAKIENQCFYVMVEDNGVGMTSEQLQKLQERLRQNRLAEAPKDTVYHHGGIGLMNVHRRIQLVFGDEYGLFVESEEGKGTRFVMKMPEQQKKRRIST